VGIVLVIGLIIFGTGVFTLGGQKKAFISTINLKAVFKDVNGLQKGNNIWFSGVKVGTIRSVSFDPAARVIVSMNVDEEVQKYIHTDAHAKVSTDGLIGNKIIVIYGGTATMPQVASGDTLSVESLTGMEGMMDTLQQNNRNLLAITANFRRISEEIAAGQGTAGRLLTQNEMANTLQAALNSLKIATKNAEALTDNLSSFSAQMKTPGTFAYDIVHDTAVFARLRRSANQLNSATGNIQTVADKLNDPNSPLGTLLTDQQAATDIKATLHNLSGGTAKFDTNMEALQHNFLLKGFFKKKRKKEAQTAKTAAGK
jgi:phospholipid/cholesterol/gamma-HCH transport system substrate-binding protein